MRKIDWDRFFLGIAVVLLSAVCPGFLAFLSNVWLGVGVAVVGGFCGVSIVRWVLKDNGTLFHYPET